MMSYKKFVQDIKSDGLRNLVILYGAEDYLIKWCTKEIIAKYTNEEFRECSVYDYSGDAITVSEAIEMASTQSMFPGKRIIILRNLPMMHRKVPESTIETDGAALLEFAKRNDLDAHIVLTIDAERSTTITKYGNKLIKASTAYSLDRLELSALRGFINKRVKAAGKYIAPHEIEQIIGLTGYMNKGSDYTLDNLQNDLVKLTSASDSSEITSKLISSLMTQESDLFVFNFIDALVAKNTGKAIEIVLGILDNNGLYEPMKLISLLTSQFEMMYDAKELAKTGMSVINMAKKLGVHEYRFKKSFKAASRFTDEMLKKSLVRLYDADKLIKTGDMTGSDALETFVLGI